MKPILQIAEISATPASVKAMLLTFLVLVLILCLIGGLYKIIEWLWGPFPPMVRTIFGIVMLVVIVMWAIFTFMPG